MLGEYVGAKTKIKMLHNICNNIWEITPDNFLQGKRCPECNSRSNGEIIISKILTENEIEYSKQYRFKDCKNKQPLPFDFAIFKNKELIYLIEYHGKQHYEPITFFGGEKGFQYRIQNDKIKYNYCIENNINLIIIPYYKYKNIEEILLKIIKEY